MKKLLGIISSIRKLGNGEIVAKAVARELGEEWELSLIRLPKLRIEPCKACYACLLPDKACNLKDDVEWLFKQIDEAEAVIFTAPNYVLGPVGMVKMLADRALQAKAYGEGFKSKRTVAALTMGKEEFRGYADTVLASQVSAIGLKVGGLEIFYGTHPGEIGFKKDFREKINHLARCLTSREPVVEDRPDRCPRCRSDLFRFGPDGIECALCKARAHLEEGRLRFSDFHHQFTEEGLKEHVEWLLQKKMEYTVIKDRLKEVREEYREGVWLFPPRG
jgi:multimeric flavodoxin WrbA